METASQTTSPMELLAVVQALPEPAPGEQPGLVAHEELVALIRAAEVLQAKIAARARQWDDSGYWAADGSRSAKDRLARDTGLAPATTARILHRGHASGSMQLAGPAWASGRLTSDHIGLLASANTPKRAELFERDEQRLIDCCTTLRFPQAQRAVARWKQLADREVDPDGAPPLPETHATVAVTYQGAVHLDIMLDPVGGEMVREQLWRIETELYQADLSAGIERTAAERRAAALVEMAVRAGTAPADGHRPEPLVCIVVGEATLTHLCETLAGTLLTPELVMPHLSASQMQTFVYDGVGDITGASPARLFTGRVRRAVQVRDRHCQHPSGCDIPAHHCEIDHVVPFARGGPTSIGNARTLCIRHNRNPGLRDRSPTEPAPDFSEQQLEFVPLAPQSPARGPDLRIAGVDVHLQLCNAA